MFDVGDEVYSGRFGEGIVTDVDNNDLYIYPIHVQWKDSCKRSIFTPEGRYNISFNDPDVDICILKVGKFKVGDHVYSKHFGEGVVERINDPKTNTYPVQVYWIGAVPRSFNASEYFTKDGKFNHRYPQPDNDIIHMFKLQDRVFYPYYGKGTVVGDFKTDVPYPIRVFWDKPYFADEPYSHFSRDGRMSLHRIDGDENFKLMLLKDVPKEETGGSEMGQIAGVINYEISKKMHEDDEGTVERMEDALNKKVEDAVNPSHYRVEGLPDAIDIINHLMHREQYEGFLWGNILKYAYRYGRKGDKAETAGKIEWYARQLKELAEVMKNDSEGTHGVGEEE